MGPGIVVAGIEAEAEEELTDCEIQDEDTDLDENIQEVIDFYYKMKEFLLEEYRTNKPINYGSLGYFTHETTNKNIKKNDSKIKKTKPIPIPISKSN